MLLQHISEFNKQARKISFLSYTDEIALGNKLKLIEGQEFEHASSSELQDFFSNIYHLLCQSGHMKSELLSNCVEILLSCVTSFNLKLRSTILSDFRFLSVLIGNILEHGTDNEKLIKILTLIRELLAYSSQLDEHNLKLIVEVLRDHTINNNNPEVSSLCLQVLANLCLENNAARYLITRTIMTTKLQEKIKNLSDDLLAYKFFILMEDEADPCDVKYIIVLSLKELTKCVTDFRLDSIRHSLDILKYLEQLGLKLNTKLNEDEKFNKSLTSLNVDLISSFLNSINSEEKWRFFDGVFTLYDKLLGIDSGLVESAEFQKFAEHVFISGVLSRSTSCLEFMKTYIQCDGKLGTMKIVVESLLDVFLTGNKETITYEQKYAFLSILEPLNSKPNFTDAQYLMIADYFDELKERFRVTEVSTIDKEEVFLFVYFVMALANLAKTHVVFYGTLTVVLSFDFLPLLMARAFLSKNQDIMMIIFRLANVEGFPNKKFSSLLANSGTRSEASSSRQSLYQSLQRRDIQTKTSKFINQQLAEELEKTIERVNARLDNNEDVKDSDVIDIYRQKISYLNDHLNSVTSSLERSTTEINELSQKIASFKKLTEKHEFANWCLQLDKERMVTEAKSLSDVNNLLKDSVNQFKARIDTEEVESHKIKASLKLKNIEIERVTTAHAELEKKLTETKERLRLAKSENESRIAELKQSLEDEKKSKGKELADAVVEQKRLNQKLTSAEKEILKLQEVINHNEKELVQKQEKIQKYESELKESEQLKSTILTLMQTKSFRK